MPSSALSRCNTRHRISLRGAASHRSQGVPMGPFAVFSACFQHVPHPHTHTGTVGLFGTPFSAPLAGHRSCPAGHWDVALAQSTPHQRCFTARQEPCSHFPIPPPVSSATLLPVRGGEGGGGIAKMACPHVPATDGAGTMSLCGRIGHPTLSRVHAPLTQETVCQAEGAP